MRILCPHCHAEESRCDGVLPECRARNAATRLLYARASGCEVESLRAEAELLRAENARLRRRLHPLPPQVCPSPLEGL